jgi:hypothetical protein
MVARGERRESMSRCTFRPRSFAEGEFGCPLDHCGHCGDHVSEGHLCRGMEVSWRHDRALEEHALSLFRSLGDRSLVAGATVEDAFVGGYVSALRGPGWMGCGQEDCEECSGAEEA